VKNEVVSRTDKAFPWILVGVLATGACSLAWNQYGSIYARDWLPYAVATALLTAGLFWSGRAQRPGRPALIGLAGLVGLSAWDAFSIHWSPVPALARDESLLVLFYALAFLVPLLLLRTEEERRLATALLVALVVALELAALVELLAVSQPTDDYENGRLTFPISYVNAQAALLLLGFWPSVALATDRGIRPALRGAAMGGACALLAGWLMTQSKGGLIALTLAGIVFFALSPDRLRAVVPTLVPVALVGGSYELLTRPFRERLGTDFADAVRFASRTALILAGVAALIGCVYALIDRRVLVPRRASRLAGRFLLAALAAVLIGSIGTFFGVADRPGHYLQERWRHFKTLPSHERGSSHLTSLGSNRYDFWRVELRLAQDHPVAGVGARGFAQRYVEERRSSETPARGHSLELDVLAETGIIGLAFLLVAIGLPLSCAIRRGRRTALLAGLAAAGVYGFTHASVDWIWTSPPIGVLLFLLLGIANAGRTVEDRGPPSIGRRVALGAGLASLALAIGAFALPWISARLTTNALRHPDQAAGDLRWARRLDPLSVEPWLAQASLAKAPPDAVAALRHAVDQQPEVSGLRYLLGLAYLRAGENVQARRALRVAHRLDPRDADIASALRRARHEG